ncbi:Starch-binding associating with outer membrane [Catalinimonas alkaloidigena]|uniref:Starch-binding associating with outer membrane n=1 Tax=Catalinimonas alkaloidigena TaxID=1075417 RepID=A0A1G9GZW8_9BACT|nr:RagB/SusD family nutrient uptake outer membrane protein [Catalinimonas alkaloidigena]SDL06248.1 Starch-binding associating with outer membrane [Catalinimonas alkaloidigena]
MKKLYFLLSTLVLLAGGCTENLDPQLYGSLSPVNFPQSENDFELYMLEVYKPFNAKWGYQDLDWQNNFYSYEYGYVQLFDAPTDLFAEFPEWGGFFEAFSKANFVFLKTQGRTSHFEKVRFVTRITKIIDDLEQADIREEPKNQFLAEAHMARGWIMYYLLHLYGPLPVILDPALIGTDAEDNLTRPDRATYVSAIAEDLQFAAEHLDAYPAEYGRFNRGIALTVLMRLYLNEKNFQQAEEIGREIQTMGYSLVEDYTSLFREATEINNETIFAVSCQPDQSGNQNQGNMNAFAFYCYPSDYPGEKVQGGWPSPNGVYAANWSFYDSFDPNDERRNLLVAEYVNKSGETRDRSNLRGAVVAKYPDEGGGTNAFQGNDLPLARYADVLLMLAEAINETSGPTAEAVELINQVRRRAGIGDLPEADIASKEALRDAILRERGWELYFEGYRKMDLVRHGKWEAALQSVGKTPGPTLLPLPDYAINNSGGQLTQNEGY